MALSLKLGPLGPNSQLKAGFGQVLAKTCGIWRSQIPKPPFYTPFWTHFGPKMGSEIGPFWAQFPKSRQGLVTEVTKTCEIWAHSVSPNFPNLPKLASRVPSRGQDLKFGPNFGPKFPNFARIWRSQIPNLLKHCLFWAQFGPKIDPLLGLVRGPKCTLKADLGPEWAQIC